jgi:sugar-specific transcriptional regulator TrmB
MDLTLLGLTAKESEFYNQLLLHGPSTVRELEKITGEQRTNCYIVLKSLENQQLVVRDDLQPVLRFKAANPHVLKTLHAKRLAGMRNVSQYITKNIPNLASLHRLTTEQQGLAYFNNLEGLKAVHRDMLTSATMVRSFISETIVQDRPEVYETLIKESVARRGQLGIKSQFIACAATEPYLSKTHLSQQGVEVRVLETSIFDGEITVYGNKVALTSYKRDGLQTIVISDKALVATFHAIFLACWEVAGATKTSVR